MEWKGKFYFGWPLPAWCGKVYEVDPAALKPLAVVILPDGTELGLELDKKGYLQVYKTSTRNRKNARTFKATFVFDTDDACPTFSGNWDDLLCKINAAAAVNALFTVMLPRGEYERLNASNQAALESLKREMSKRATSLVQLRNDWCDSGPALVLLRTGLCP